MCLGASHRLAKFCSVALLVVAILQKHSPIIAKKRAFYDTLSCAKLSALTLKQSTKVRLLVHSIFGIHCALLLLSLVGLDGAELAAGVPARVELHREDQVRALLPRVQAHVAPLPDLRR